MMDKMLAMLIMGGLRMRNESYFRDFVKMTVESGIGSAGVNAEMAKAENIDALVTLIRSPLCDLIVNLVSRKPVENGQPPKPQ